MTIATQIVLGLFQGSKLYQEQKHSRALCVGREEQKINYCFRQYLNIGNCSTEIFADLPHYSEKFAIRFAFLNTTTVHLVLAAVSTFYCDFIALHIPDLIYCLSTIHAVSCVFYNKNRLKYSICLIFSILSFLENGFFYKKPKENQGLLFQNEKTKKIISLYSPIIEIINNIGLPINIYLSKNIIFKLWGSFELLTCISYLFKQSDMPFSSTFLFKEVQCDYYKTQKLEQIKQNLEKAASNERKKFIKQLYAPCTQISGLHQSNLKRKLKNIFGFILENPQNGWKTIEEESNSLLCQGNILQKIDDIYIKILPLIAKKGNTSKKSKEDLQLSAKVKWIAQTFRNQLFKEYIIEAARARGKLFFPYEQREIDAVSNKTKKICLQNLYTMNNSLGLFYGTNLHQFNYYVAYYGTELGLSYYEDLKNDPGNDLEAIRIKRNVLDVFGANLIKKRFIACYLYMLPGLLEKNFAPSLLNSPMLYDFFQDNCEKNNGVYPPIEKLLNLKKQIEQTPNKNLEESFNQVLRVLLNKVLKEINFPSLEAMKKKGKTMAKELGYEITTLNNEDDFCREMTRVAIESIKKQPFLSKHFLSRAWYSYTYI